MLLGDRVVTFLDGRVSPRPERAEFLALILARDERHLDALRRDLAAVKAEPRFRIRPAIGQLSCVAGRR